MRRSLSAREQHIFIICLVTVFFCACYYSFVLPLRDKNDSIREEIKFYWQQISGYQEILQTEKTYMERPWRSSRMGTGDVSVARSEIEEAAGQAGIQLKDVIPREDRLSSFARRVSANLTLRGRFLDVMRFIYALQQRPYWWGFSEAEFKKLTGDNEDLVAAHFVIDKVFLDADWAAGHKHQRSPAENPGSEPKPFEAYAQKIRQRDFFALPQNKTETGERAASESLSGLRQRIKLIGISLDEHSQVVVEDLKSREIHFLSMGESVGPVSVEEILRDRAVFLYNNERVEMRL